MGNLCIIPARGGSKRIPGKNIRDFRGMPIIAYSIRAALASGLFEEVMVSTDSEEIAEVALAYGAAVPFYRSAQTSDDFATTADVIHEVIVEYEQKGKSFENVCCCYATAPFVTPQRLVEGYNRLRSSDVSAVFPVSEFSYPIYRSLKMDADNLVSFNWPEYINSRSQDLPQAFHDAGQWYWLKVNEFIKSAKIIGNNSIGLKLDQTEVQDIDNEIDWKLAELKYELLQSIK